MVNFYPQSYNTSLLNSGVAGGANQALAGGAGGAVAGGLGTSAVAGGAQTAQSFSIAPQGDMMQQFMGLMMSMMQMFMSMLPALMGGQQAQTNNALAGGAGGAVAGGAINNSIAGGAVAGGAINNALAGGAGGAVAGGAINNSIAGSAVAGGSNLAVAGGANYSIAGGSYQTPSQADVGEAMSYTPAAYQAPVQPDVQDPVYQAPVQPDVQEPTYQAPVQPDVNTYTPAAYEAPVQPDVNPYTPAEPEVPAYDTPQVTDYNTDYNGGGNGYGEGDPHFRDFDAKESDPKWSYDVMGEAGKNYSILEDKGVAVNAKFEEWGDKGATIMGEVGLKLGDDQIKFDAREEGEKIALSNAAPTLNGEAIEANTDITLADGSTVRWDGNNLVNVNTNEYNFNITRNADPQGSHMKIDTSINEGGPFSDGVAAHGILGQTADGDGKVRSGDKGVGAQGGGAIETLNAAGEAVMSEAGDKTVHTNYEVDNLFDILDNSFGRFNAAVGTGLKPIVVEPGIATTA